VGVYEKALPTGIQRQNRTNQILHQTRNQNHQVSGFRSHRPNRTAKLRGYSNNIVGVEYCALRHPHSSED
jgi:hypothetical protein